MRRFFFLSAMVLSVWIAAIAGINEKLSASTQLFIAERNGEISLDVQLPGPKLQSRAPLLRTQPVERYIARSERVNGVDMVSAFIHINPRFATKLESFGVVIQEGFNEFVTALIPVDKIERIAEIAEVQEINVASVVKKFTDKARYYTNTDDVLSYSSSAVQAGLPQAFKGAGVVVGVIDGGIDFQHNMFKDANGAYRIKKAYIGKSSGLTEYSSFASLTTDDTSESHGTHTSSTAAGSEITVSGVTYGGMAPEADLVLVGLGNYMYNTNIANAIKKICDYADSQNKPAVVSISLGSHIGPHDGTGELASVYAQYGGSHPNHIIINAAGNEAGNGSYYGIEGYVYGCGEASSSKPYSTVMNGYAGNSKNQAYSGIDIFYARTANKQIACKLHVVNTSSNEVVWTSSAITSSTSSVSGFTTYFSASPQVTIARDSYNNKYYVRLSTNCTKKTGYTDSKFALAISIYPTSGSCMIDGWDHTGNNYFGKYAKTVGDYTFVSGSDKCSIGDEAASNDLISVGAYASKTSVKDYNGVNHSLSGYYSLGKIAFFSSYQAPGYGPTGEHKPDICAPGATIVAGINHYDNTSMNDGWADYGYYLVYKNGASSLGSMDGTSMSTPCVAGIIALYLQAAKSVGKSLNTAGIRDVFANSAIHDNNTTNVAFGPYGKIDALAGIQYILDSEPLPVPTLTVNPTSLSFTGNVGKTYTKTFTLTGTDLTGNVTLAVSGNAYSVSPTTISAEDAAAGATVTVTYAPTAAGTATGTVTASTAGGNNVTVSLSGTATVVPTLTVTPDALSFSTNVGTPVTQTFTLLGANLTGGVYLECSGTGFTINKTNATKTAAMNGVEVTATYNPSTAGNHTGRVLLRSAGADTVYVQLSGTAVAPKYDPVMQTANQAYVTTTSFRADWTDATMASQVASYTLEVGTDFATTLGNLMATETGDANHRLVTDIPSNQHYYNIANLTAGGAYVYRVKALYTDGTESNWSNVQQVTLLQGHGYQLGDVNHDGNVAISDVTALIDYLLAGDGAASGCAICGDVNESGDVTIADVTALIDMLLSTPSSTRGYGVLLK